MPSRPPPGRKPFQIQMDFSAAWCEARVFSFRDCAFRGAFFPWPPLFPKSKIPPLLESLRRNPSHCGGWKTNPPQNKGGPFLLRHRPIFPRPPSPLDYVEQLFRFSFRKSSSPSRTFCSKVFFPWLDRFLSSPPEVKFMLRTIS